MSCRGMVPFVDVKAASLSHHCFLIAIALIGACDLCKIVTYINIMHI